MGKEKAYTFFGRCLIIIIGLDLNMKTSIKNTMLVLEDNVMFINNGGSVNI